MKENFRFERNIQTQHFQKTFNDQVNEGRDERTLMVNRGDKNPDLAERLETSDFDLCIQAQK